MGTLVAPGVGTVVGAMHGTGNTKNKQESESTTHSYERTREEVSDIIVDVCYMDGRQGKLNFKCYSEQANILISLMEKNSVVDDLYDELKKLKELLDMGIVSQEEFNLKKKELLGL